MIDLRRNRDFKWRVVFILYPESWGWKYWRVMGAVVGLLILISFQSPSRIKNGEKKIFDFHKWSNLKPSGNKLVGYSHKTFYLSFIYHCDSEKQEGRGVVAHAKLTEPRFTLEWLLAKPRSFSKLPAFLDLNGMIKF